MQEQSREIWGRSARGSSQPSVNAYPGNLPDRRGIEFTTDIAPMPGSAPNEARWYWEWCPGVLAAAEGRAGFCLHPRDQLQEHAAMTVRILKYVSDFEVVPQAIIWRPLRYCTLVIREGEDDLDKFEGTSFTIGNDIRFDLRVYQGHIHPEVTVTLYLPEDVRDEKRVSEIVSLIIKEMAIPVSAIAWRRGQKFQFGKLERSPQDRLREREARILLLKIAASQPERSATIGKLREEVPKYFDLSPVDQTRSPSRKNERLWQIVVRNTMSSHTTGTRTIFAQGWAKKIPGGLKVTRRGMDYLNSIGFSDSSSSDLTGDE
jgi:hypothetical protein